MHSISYFAVAMVLMAGAAESQSIEILSANEADGSVLIEIQTDMATPFEVMVGIELANQAGQDIFIGTNQRVTIEGPMHSVSIPTLQEGEALPTGDYDVTVDFYPGWGAKSAPEATRAIKTEVNAMLPISLSGSGTKADVVERRNAAQAWVMGNTAMGEKFDMATYINHAGKPEHPVPVTNRNHMVAHYFPVADVTLFENTLKGELVVWRLGRTNKL